jgi:hypothetical protein
MLLPSSRLPIIIKWMRVCKGKGRHRTGHEGPEGEWSYSFILPSTSALDDEWVVSTTPRAALPPGKEPVPIVQEVGWAPGAGMDGCGKSCSPPGFDPRTLQPVASRCTD